jgi:hypothetical protein
MSSETLDADFYHRRSELCLELAAMVPTARPLFSRLRALSVVYATKAAAAADSKDNGVRQAAQQGGTLISSQRLRQT